MKKASIFFLLLFLSVAYTGFSQATPPTDFFAGKWEIAVTGTPMGDVKFLTDLVRKDGKLTGELANPAEPNAEKRKITKVEENGDKVAIFFESSQAGEISIDLTKVDNGNLKGTLYNFDAVAKRVK
ncbi:hypothetical protein IC229_18880 [Spirosoma sp. BT702]|uniref:Uncharacterized protein n=1 Tax=Spirosoma profusum TaxID=2771354 RepID=A0A927ANW1_9BACT|nr:hypothetical protein [Spirosoma profusum]MBD2702719.1 hypothetical protein [Spirosoma profusum]